MDARHNLEIHKYPRTYHIEGSNLQPGDEGMGGIAFSSIAGRYLVVEEKTDGANAGISFTASGELLLQSRGHYLTGGPREKHFALFKQWAYTHMATLWPVLGTRYIMYGEWLYARHTMFYNALPHYFMEFDVLDKKTGQFLSTARRQEMLAGLPVVSVKVLKDGVFRTLDELTGLVGPSYFIQGDQIAALRELCAQQHLDADRAVAESDTSGLMEGLYIKVEEDGCVSERYKSVRGDFLTKILESDTHWLSRPIIPNQLRPDVNLFAV
jgi:hypothetical protein